MPTDKQREASRRNGAKSKGPMTPEGKQTSSRNAVTHGLTAVNIVLWGESEQEFQQLLNAYFLDLKPAGPTESDLVTEIANIAWTLRRAWASTRIAVETHIAEKSDWLSKRYKDPSVPLHIGLANSAELHDGRAEAIYRHIARLERTLQRTIRFLHSLQDRRRNQPPVPQTGAPDAPTPPPPLENENSQNEPEAALTPIATTPSVSAWEPLSPYHTDRFERILGRPSPELPANVVPLTKAAA